MRKYGSWSKIGKNVNYGRSLMNQFFLWKKLLNLKYLLDVDAQMDLFCTIFTKNV